jgi:hypothetical protein
VSQLLPVNGGKYSVWEKAELENTSKKMDSNLLLFDANIGLDEFNSQRCNQAILV